jgi:hypothetical protein
MSVVTQALLLYIFCVHVMILLFPAMLMRDENGKSIPMQVGFCTGTHRRLEWLRKAFSSRAKRMFLTREW